MPFTKGPLGNPKVKPKEVSETTTIAAKQLLDAEAETLTAGLLELAGRWGITIVLVKPGKTEKEAWEDQLAEHPEEKEAEKVFYLDSV
jgi:hypothetical protein